jgi:hypothetical protein
MVTITRLEEEHPQVGYQLPFNLFVLADSPAAARKIAWLVYHDILPEVHPTISSVFDAYMNQPMPMRRVYTPYHVRFS